MMKKLEELGNGKDPINVQYGPPLFHEALKETRKLQEDKEMFETFSNYALNVPLLKLIESVPRYTKFLKERCTISRK